MRVQIRAGQAVVSTKDESVTMIVPASYITRRLRCGEAEAYFTAQLVDGMLEIGERAEGWS